MKITVPASLVAAAGPGKRQGRSNSLKWPWLYDKLRAKGYDKSKAAAISNSRIGTRKNGRISVLSAKSAHNKAVLKRLAAADRAGKHSTKRTLRASASVANMAFACNDKSCAPPPVGTGGSKKSSSAKPHTTDHARVLYQMRSGSGPARPSESATKRLEAEGHIVKTGKRVGNSTIYKLTPSGKELVGRVAFGERGIITIKPHQDFKVITAAQARGDSRPVSHEEFQRLAQEGQRQLDGFAAKSSPHTGLDERWTAVKSESYAEVTKSWGGATIDAHTGKALPQGADKYAITVKSQKHETISVPENATEAEFNAAMDRAKSSFSGILQRESHYLGVFHDDENRRIDIDPVLVVSKRSDVDTIGAASHAIGGAYNFSDGNGYWPPHVAEGA